LKGILKRETNASTANLDKEGSQMTKLHAEQIFGYDPPLMKSTCAEALYPIGKVRVVKAP
jgi:hypothetical protein